MRQRDDDLLDVRHIAQPLQESADLDPLMERIGDARLVLLGEASHGTEEYYGWRAALTRRLIAECGFSFVSVEGDWPDCWALNRCVQLAPGAPAEPQKVLEDFDRWPTWMWANRPVEQFASWLRAYNSELPAENRVGFYGLDVYSLWDSLRAILGYLEEHEPAYLETARQAWRCFERYREDPQEYAWATRLAPASCEDAVVSLLSQLRQATGVAKADDAEARFDAEQNAAVAAGAEHYYRAMVRGGPDSWNVRDMHMADTLDRLLAYRGGQSKAVVWEHNTHVGDARATDMAADGLVNVGQLTRERHAAEGVVLVGFGGYEGSVIAADAWGSPPQRLPVPGARPGSLEALLAEALADDALFVFGQADQPSWLRRWIDHRAIGVVYHPERERWGNYVPTVVGDRYDAFLFFNATAALAPIPAAATGAEQETFPAGV